MRHTVFYHKRGGFSIVIYTPPIAAIRGLWYNIGQVNTYHKGGVRIRATIVLPNLNGAGWLEGSIESLYAQTVPDFELIIVDNGSTDESLHTAREYAKRENCILIENSANTGFSAAVNAGIRLAKAPYVLLFNNDAFAKPDMVERMLEAIEKDGRIFAVQCLMLRHYEPEKADDAGDYVSLFGWPFKRGDGLPASRYTKPRRVFSCCGGAAMYRKAILDEIGLFDENFFAYFEDVDIGWRANSLGYQNRIEPAAQCTHICGATTSEGGSQYNDFKSIQSGRNSLLLPWKNMPIVMYILNFPFLFIGYLVKALVFRLRGYAKPWNQGMHEAFAVAKKLQKPKFRFRNLPHYFWVEGSLIVGLFEYIGYRARRFFVK